MSQTKRLLISLAVLISIWLTLSVISSQASSIQGDVVLGGSSLTTPGVIPRVSSPGNLGNSKLSCTATSPAFCTLYDDTPITGASSFKIRTGASQAAFAYALVTSSNDANVMFSVAPAGPIDTGINGQFKAFPGTNAEASWSMFSGGGGGAGDDAYQAFFQGASLKWVTAGVWNGATTYTLFNGGFSPQLELTQAGALRLNSYGAGALTTDASGNVTAVSDERLKYIQRPFRRGLRQITQLKPIVYKWRPESGLETKHEYAGFSAQQVRQFIPEAVGQDPAGHLTFQDRPIEAALVNAVQELAAQVKTLQGRVAQLEAKQRAKP